MQLNADRGHQEAAAEAQGGGEHGLARADPFHPPAEDGGGSPRTTIAMEKIHPSCFKSQSPGAECVMPISLVRGRLKVEKA